MPPQVRETDIETLERCVGAVAFGDLEAEDSRNLTEINFMRIFRLGQLTAEYLLHVQDRLAYDNSLLKVPPPPPGIYQVPPPLQRSNVDDDLKY